jgi:hypothetical protein
LPRLIDRQAWRGWRTCRRRSPTLAPSPTAVRRLSASPLARREATGSITQRSSSLHRQPKRPVSWPNRIRHLSTDQEIAGSSPAEIDKLSCPRGYGSILRAAKAALAHDGWPGMDGASGPWEGRRAKTVQYDVRATDGSGILSFYAGGQNLSPTFGRSLHRGRAPRWLRRLPVAAAAAGSTVHELPLCTGIGAHSRTSKFAASWSSEGGWAHGWRATERPPPPPSLLQRRVGCRLHRAMYRGAGRRFTATRRPAPA